MIIHTYSFPKYLILFIGIVSVSSYCQSQNVIAEKANLLVVEKSLDIELYKDFKKYGKEAIPYLIAVIDTNKEGFVGFKDPESSVLYSNFNLVGLRAAYMIEYILSGSDKYTIYANGIIVKKNGTEIGDTGSLTLADISKVKKIYADWWSANQKKPLTSLSKSWKAGKRILDNSDFTWK